MSSAALTKMNTCLQDVKRWMALSKMKLNPDKTEFIVFGFKAQCQKLSSHFLVNILSMLHYPSDTVKNLGIWFDTQFFSQKMLRRLEKPAVFFQICDLRRIRQYLSHEVANLATNALVNSCLDYHNSTGLSSFNQHKLQNTIVTNQRKHAHFTPTLK